MLSSTGFISALYMGYVWIAIMGTHGNFAAEMDRFSANSAETPTEITMRERAQMIKPFHDDA